MIVSEAMSQINMSYRGSDDDVPVAGTLDYILWLGTMNRKLQEYAKDQWISQFSHSSPNEVGTVSTVGTTTLTGVGTYFTDYQSGDKITVNGETVRTIDTITSDTVLTITVAFTNTASSLTFTRLTLIKSGVQTYNLHRRFSTPSDEVKIISTQTDTFKLEKPQDREAGVAYIHSANPQKITFYDDITATSLMIGGTLIVPAYYLPADLVNATDIIPCDDPYFIVYSTASELAGNELTYADKAGALNAKANNLYRLMKNANRKGTSNNPRTAPVSVDRISGN